MPRLLFAVLAALATAAFIDFAPATVSAQQAPARALTAADYARAERFMSYNVNPLVLAGNVTPVWLDGNRFWYRVTKESGDETFLVDAATATRAAYTPSAA